MTEHSDLQSAAPDSRVKKFGSMKELLRRREVNLWSGESVAGQSNARIKGAGSRGEANGSSAICVDDKRTGKAEARDGVCGVRKVFSPAGEELEEVPEIQASKKTRAKSLAVLYLPEHEVVGHAGSTRSMARRNEAVEVGCFMKKRTRGCGALINAVEVGSMPGNREKDSTVFAKSDQKAMKMHREHHGEGATRPQMQSHRVKKLKPQFAGLAGRNGAVMHGTRVGTTRVTAAAALQQHGEGSEGKTRITACTIRAQGLHGTERPGDVILAKKPKRKLFLVEISDEEDTMPRSPDCKGTEDESQKDDSRRGEIRESTETMARGFPPSARGAESSRRRSFLQHKVIGVKKRSPRSTLHREAHEPVAQRSHASKGKALRDSEEIGSGTESETGTQIPESPSHTQKAKEKQLEKDSTGRSQGGTEGKGKAKTPAYSTPHSSPLQHEVQGRNQIPPAESPHVFKVRRVASQEGGETRENQSVQPKKNLVRHKLGNELLELRKPEDVVAGFKGPTYSSTLKDRELIGSVQGSVERRGQYCASSIQLLRALSKQSCNLTRFAETDPSLVDEMAVSCPSRDGLREDLMIPGDPSAPLPPHETSPPRASPVHVMKPQAASTLHNLEDALQVAGSHAFTNSRKSRYGPRSGTLRVVSSKKELVMNSLSDLPSLIHTQAPEIRGIPRRSENPPLRSSAKGAPDTAACGSGPPASSALEKAGDEGDVMVCKAKEKILSRRRFVDPSFKQVRLSFDSCVMQTPVQCLNVQATSGRTQNGIIQDEESRQPETTISPTLASRTHSQAPPAGSDDPAMTMMSDHAPTQAQEPWYSPVTPPPLQRSSGCSPSCSLTVLADPAPETELHNTADHHCRLPHLESFQPLPHIQALYSSVLREASHGNGHEEEILSFTADAVTRCGEAKSVQIGGLPKGLAHPQTVLMETVAAVLGGFDFAPARATMVEELAFLDDGSARITFESEGVADIFCDACSAWPAALAIGCQTLVVGRKKSAQHDLAAALEGLLQAKGHALIPSRIFYVGNLPHDWLDESILRAYFARSARSATDEVGDPDCVAAVHLLPVRSAAAYIELTSRALTDVLFHRLSKGLISSSGKPEPQMFICRHSQFIPMLAKSAISSDSKLHSAFMCHDFHQQVLHCVCAPQRPVADWGALVEKCFQRILKTVVSEGLERASVLQVLYHEEKASAMVMLDSECTADAVMDVYIDSPREFHIEGIPFTIYRDCIYIRPGALYRSRRNGHPERKFHKPGAKDGRSAGRVVCFRPIDDAVPAPVLRGALNEVIERALAASGELEMGKAAVNDLHKKEGEREVIVRLQTSAMGKYLLGLKKPLRLAGRALTILPCRRKRQMVAHETQDRKILPPVARPKDQAVRSIVRSPSHEREHPAAAPASVAGDGGGGHFQAHQTPQTGTKKMLEEDTFLHRSASIGVPPPAGSSSPLSADKSCIEGSRCVAEAASVSEHAIASVAAKDDDNQTRDSSPPGTTSRRPGNDGRQEELKRHVRGANAPHVSVGRRRWHVDAAMGHRYEHKVPRRSGDGDPDYQREPSVQRTKSYWPYMSGEEVCMRASPRRSWHGPRDLADRIRAAAHTVHDSGAHQGHPQHGRLQRRSAEDGRLWAPMSREARHQSGTRKDDRAPNVATLRGHHRPARARPQQENSMVTLPSREVGPWDPSPGNSTCRGPGKALRSPRLLSGDRQLRGEDGDSYVEDTGCDPVAEIVENGGQVKPTQECYSQEGCSLGGWLEENHAAPAEITAEPEFRHKAPVAATRQELDEDDDDEEETISQAGREAECEVATAEFDEPACREDDCNLFEEDHGTRAHSFVKPPNYPPQEMAPDAEAEDCGINSHIAGSRRGGGDPQKQPISQLEAFADGFRGRRVLEKLGVVTMHVEPRLPDIINSPQSPPGHALSSSLDVFEDFPAPPQLMEEVTSLPLYVYAELTQATPMPTWAKVAATGTAHHGGPHESLRPSLGAHPPELQGLTPSGSSGCESSDLESSRSYAGCASEPQSPTAGQGNRRPNLELASVCAVAAGHRAAALQVASLLSKEFSTGFNGEIEECIKPPLSNQKLFHLYTQNGLYEPPRGERNL